MARKTAAQKTADATRRIALTGLIAGATVSVAANIVSAEPTILGRTVAAWPALALLLTVHLFQHARRTWAIKVAILAVAAVAAWVSYWHMVDVALMAGENSITAHILPATVDAMMYVATIVLTTKTAQAKKRTARRPAAKVTPIRRAA